jgi:RNA polymerase sigma factor (sigma-70 family)
MEEILTTDNFETIYKKVSRNFAERSKDMSLLDIIIKIDTDKEYIFDFIWTEQIQQLIKDIGNRYKFNRDEAEDIAIFSITEYFYENTVSIKGFDEDVFLDNLKDEVGKRTQKMIREGYTAKEIPASGQNIYQYAMYDNFEDSINNSVDLENVLNRFSGRDREILELYYIDKYTQQEIAKLMHLSRKQINRILLKLKNIIKN